LIDAAAAEAQGVRTALVLLLLARLYITGD